MTQLLVHILYPERKLVPASRVMQWAKDVLATEYIKANPGVDENSGAIEANSIVSGLDEAMEILSDSGTVTFGRQ